MDSQINDETVFEPDSDEETLEEMVLSLTPKKKAEIFRFIKSIPDSLAAALVPSYTVNVTDALLDIGKHLSETVRLIRGNEAKYPSNWIGFGQFLIQNPDIDDERIHRVVFDEGIPTAWAFPDSVLTSLFTASDLASRKKIILKNESLIQKECRQLISGVTGSSWKGTRTAQKPSELLVLAQKAIAAHQSGHFESSQSLATVIIDTLLSGYHVKMSTKTKDFKATFQTNATKLATYLVFAPIYNAHISVNKDHHLAGYNRHVSVHAASLSQYKRVHTIIALINMTALIKFTEEFGQVNSSLVLASKP